MTSDLCKYQFHDLINLESLVNSDLVDLISFFSVDAGQNRKSNSAKNIRCLK